MNPNMKKSFNVFLEGVCKMYSIPDEAKILLQKGVNALEEAHFDRTTGGNFFGKTIRDQNEYDNRYNCLGEGEPTKTAGLTDSLYGFSKNGVKGMGMSGKFGNAYDLHDDGRHTTGSNTGIAATGRREMKRKENEFWDNEIENELSDLGEDDVMDITYEPMSKTQLKGVDPAVFGEPTGNKLGDFTTEDTFADFGADDTFDDFVGESVNYTGTDLGGQGKPDPRKRLIMSGLNRVATERKLPHTNQFKIAGGRTINVTFALNDVTVTLDDGTELARITQPCWCQYGQQRKLVIGKVADVIIELADKINSEQAAQ